MQSINQLHAKICPTKSLSNFWRSVDYIASAKAVETKGENPKSTSVAGTQVHPLVAAAFIRWADPERFYRKLESML